MINTQNNIPAIVKKDSVVFKYLNQDDSNIKHPAKSMFIPMLFLPIVFMVLLEQLASPSQKYGSLIMVVIAALMIFILAIFYGIKINKRYIKSINSLTYTIEFCSKGLFLDREVGSYHKEYDIQDIQTIKFTTQSESVTGYLGRKSRIILHGCKFYMKNKTIHEFEALHENTLKCIRDIGKDNDIDLDGDHTFLNA